MGGKGIAPGIVGIGNHPVAIRVINGNDISLRIGAIIEDRAFHTAGIGGGEQLKHGRTAGGVVEIAQIKGERVAVVNHFPVDLAARIPRHLSGGTSATLFRLGVSQPTAFSPKVIFAGIVYYSKGKPSIFETGIIPLGNKSINASVNNSIVSYSEFDI